MGFNPLHFLTTGAAAFMSTGNPLYAVASGITGGMQTSDGITNTVNANNTAQSFSTQWFTNAEQSIQNDQLMSKLAMDWQSNQFNKAIDERSEIMRETNTLRDISMEQRKSDIQIEKEFIKSIG